MNVPRRLFYFVKGICENTESSKHCARLASPWRALNQCHSHLLKALMHRAILRIVVNLFELSVELLRNLELLFQTVLKFNGIQDCFADG